MDVAALRRDLGAGPESPDCALSGQEAKSMRHLLRSRSVGMLITMLALGCVTPPPAGVPAPATVEVLPADARALRYGASAPAVFDNAEVRDKIRMMFGSDWTPAAQGGGRLRYGAAA